MFTLKVKLGQNFTLTDVIEECKQNGIATHLIQEKSDSNNIILGFDDKYHQNVLDIIEILESKNETYKYTILLNDTIDIDKIMTLNITNKTKTEIVFNTKTPMKDLLYQINTKLSIDEQNSIIEIQCQICEKLS
jgi:hypothetical protein